MRRHVIVAGLVGALVLVAGCSAIPGGDATTELGPVTVENGDEAAHVVHVLVERDSKPVYGTTVGLDGVSPATNESDFGSIDSVVLNHSSWTGRSANWTVYTRVNSSTSWRAHAVPGEDECTSVRLKVQADGSVTSFTPNCSSWPPSVAG